MAYKKIHQIRIDFNVTEKTRRYVFVYIIEAGNCYMIDSGVYGSEKQISSYIVERRILSGAGDTVFEDIAV